MSGQPNTKDEPRTIDSRKPILVLDFDGVIHSYEKGWQGGIIYGNATAGFFDWAEKARDVFQLHVFSSRSDSHKNILPMKDWMTVQLWAWHMEKYNISPCAPGLIITDFEFPDRKPAAFLTIDDRVVCFNGNWEAMDIGLLRSFKPWNDSGEEPEKTIKHYDGHGI